MKRILYLFGTSSLCSLLNISLFTTSCKSPDLTVSSPDGNYQTTLIFDKERGSVAYQVKAGDIEIISRSQVGIDTDITEFNTGMKLMEVESMEIDEIYTLPQGKTSTYRNQANEITLKLRKDSRDVYLKFRAYDDGIAFRYVIPGNGNIEIVGESSTINLSGENFTYWGQDHPNKYGYESALGPIEGKLMSNPVLAHLEDRNYFVLMGQAATNGQYVQSHFIRSGPSFRYAFPLDQEKIGPVTAALPFQSPWRVAIISPDYPGRIVESYLMENLNPPTDSRLLNDNGVVKDWVKPGRVMWDFIAKDNDKPRMWIDAASEMGWEYYMADARFAEHWGGSDSVIQVLEYADTKHVGVIGWAHTREFNTPAKAAETINTYANWGLKGAKIDFFDHNTLSESPRDWRDYEDTQQSLKMRDWILDLGTQNEFLLELHGNTIPTGERRQYPNLMTLEGVDGMERRAKPPANDLTIPYVRNVMGPVSYTIIHFERSPGTHAYQMAMSVVYEAGLKIYAEHGQKLLEWPGREMIKDVPAAWDETKFIEGWPGSYIVMARRKGQDWYVAGMTDEARTVELTLNFLTEGTNYDGLLFKDNTHDTMTREILVLNNSAKLSIDLLDRGGFTLRLNSK